MGPVLPCVRLGPLPRLDVGNREGGEVGALRIFPAPVVMAAGGLGGGVAHAIGDGGEVVSGGQQGGSEGAAADVRGDRPEGRARPERGDPLPDGVRKAVSGSWRTI